MWSSRNILIFFVSTRGKHYSRISVFSQNLSLKEYAPDNIINNGTPCSTDAEQRNYYTLVGNTDWEETEFWKWVWLKTINTSNQAIKISFFLVIMFRPPDSILWNCDKPSNAQPCGAEDFYCITWLLIGWYDLDEKLEWVF